MKKRTIVLIVGIALILLAAVLAFVPAQALADDLDLEGTGLDIPRTSFSSEFLKWTFFNPMSWIGIILIIIWIVLVIKSKKVVAQVARA